MLKAGPSTEMFLSDSSVLNEWFFEDLVFVLVHGCHPSAFLIAWGLRVVGLVLRKGGHMRL